MPEPSERSTVDITVNGELVSRTVPARQNLVDFLRDELGLTGTHVGCEHGICGACTVQLDGEIVRGCLVLAIQCDGRSVQTIEGLTASGALADLQREFHARNALQCGFCTPGMLLTAAEIVDSEAAPDREAIRSHLSGNYCRCTGYHAIVDAVEAACAARRERQGE